LYRLFFPKKANPRGGCAFVLQLLKMYVTFVIFVFYGEKSGVFGLPSLRNTQKRDKPKKLQAKRPKRLSAWPLAPAC
jgi:hypothetical protein